MSRIAKSPVELPKGVTVTLNENTVKVKGSQGELQLQVHQAVSVKEEEGQLVLAGADDSRSAWAMAGTMRSLIKNMVIGVSQGFERRLLLNGVGYRAAAQGTSLNLTLGYSHPLAYQLPEGVSVETPSQTEIVIKGMDKQQVGQVAAEIRAFRPPEPYKGKGVRYSDENIRRKEAKKK